MIGLAAKSITAWRKKFLGLMIFALLILVAGPTFAGPFLVCDPTTDAQAYSVDLNGTVTSAIPIQAAWIKDNKLYLTDPGGTRTPCHVLMDLVNLTAGTYNVKVYADYGVWGVSAATPLSFPRPTLSPSQGVRLTK